jgi:hypothetical protein
VTSGATGGVRDIERREDADEEVVLDDNDVRPYVSSRSRPSVATRRGDRGNPQSIGGPAPMATGFGRASIPADPVSPVRSFP